MSKYPILPLRNTVIFPEQVVPIQIGRPSSVTLVEDVMMGDSQMVVIAQRDEKVDLPDREDLYEYGTLVTILKVMMQEDGVYTAIVRGTQRAKLEDLTLGENEYYVGTFSFPRETRAYDANEHALMKSLKDTASELVEKTNLPTESILLITNQNDPSLITDFILSHASLEVKDKQEFLEEFDINTRLENCIKMMVTQMDIAQVSENIMNRVREETANNQKEYYLRQQLKAIQEQLGQSDDDLGDLESRINASNLPDHVRKVAVKQYGRLQNMQPSSSEYSVTTNYIETLLDVPWTVFSEDDLDLSHAQEILDDDHYGLNKVKDRIIQYLAVLSLKSDMKGPILCFHGPPGVGKTSLAKSISRSMGRKFARIALGGVHDESEIRGHRRTYVGALPGRIAQAVIKSGTMNPVILLDEIDKVGRDFRGDPSAALLEVLDPEQNHTFSDHYLDVELDLSKVLFIATANQLDTISPPLRDRMEIIDVPSYTLYEKQQIAKRYLIPKQITDHGMESDNITFKDDVIRHLIDKYTREAGVRNLERRVADLCRNVAVDVAKTPAENRDTFHKEVDTDLVEKALGPERYISEMAQRTNMVGVATGLAWTQSGGDILFIEAQVMPGKGEVKLTGQLGDVMKESVHAALSYIRANEDKLEVKADLNTAKTDLHVHVPAGAIPKDGPSAGITMFTAIFSRLTNKMVRKDLAMTGEITLSGNVLPVGGIKEKTIAAHRAGIKHVIMPALCKKDLVDVDEDVKKDVTFHFVSHVEEIIPLVFAE